VYNLKLAELGDVLNTESPLISRGNALFGIVLVVYLARLFISFVIISTEGLEFNIWSYGHDELQWQRASLLLPESGISSEYITFLMNGEASWSALGFPSVVGLLHLLMGASYENVLIVKFGTLALALLSLNFLYDHKPLEYRCSVMICYLLYWPLLILSWTYMRDDYIVNMILIFCALSKALIRKPSLMMIFLIALVFQQLMFTRVAASLVAISLSLFYFLDLKIISLVKLRWKLITFSMAIFGSIMLFIQKGFFDTLVGFIITNAKVDLSIIFLSAKWFLGPLPWNMVFEYVDSGLNPAWYMFTLAASLLLLLNFKSIRSIQRHFVTLLLLWITGFLPYYFLHWSVDIVGPRQFAMVGFFHFLIVYSWIFDLKKLKRGR